MDIKTKYDFGDHISIKLTEYERGTKDNCPECKGKKSPKGFVCKECRDDSWIRSKEVWKDATVIRITTIRDSFRSNIEITYSVILELVDTHTEPSWMFGVDLDDTETLIEFVNIKTGESSLDKTPLEETYDCVVHGAGEGPDCPRC